ncbi:MAG: DUF4830 domain-containing protein [Clostridia bacterium]|nr:DUF4830 domain-containing protein [Clostridia bacterium]
MGKTFFEGVIPMFVLSVRMSTLKFAGAIVLCLALLVGVFVMADTSEPSALETVKYEGIDNESLRRSFLEELGWELASEGEKAGELVLPKNFDRVLTGYNEIQRKQGLDLTKYNGKTVERYTYVVTNYPNHEGTVYANLLIYRGRVIGGDISSSDHGGFVRELTYPKL